MSVSITIPGANFSKYVSKVLMPYFDIASGYYLFGTDASSLKNLAYGASQNLSLVASPTYGTGYATITGINGFDTGFLLDTPYTQIAVVQSVSNAVGMFGRGSGADAYVDMLRLDVSGQLDQFPNGSVTTIAGGVSTASGFALIGQSWGGTGTYTKLFSASAGSLSVTSPSSTVTKTATPTSTLKIGATYNAGNTAKIAAAAIFPSVLTDAQVLEIYNYLKPLLATRGITVL